MFRQKNLTDEVDCLEIRSKKTHASINPNKIKLVHLNAAQKWIWGASRKFGFHCFYGLQEKGETCHDYQFRVFKNCKTS